MIMKRRAFLQKSTLAGLGMMLGNYPLFAMDDHDIIRLTILHTNDVHSRIEPFPDDGSRNAGLGGVSRRGVLIERIRRAEDHVLLFDSGDIFQGTPYFNFFGGELEIKLMTELGYDAATMGNHDFDAGVEGFAKQLVHADFPILISNYDFRDTPMAGKYKPYKIFGVEYLKIGVFGLGIELDGLVPKALYGNTVYQDPIQKANEISNILRHDEKCDFVICLSHLGYKYREGTNKVCDIDLATHTSEIDLILGGHTHTFMHEPDIRKNRKGQEVVINQVGWAGIMLGRIEVFFERNRRGRCVSCKNTYVV